MKRGVLLLALGAAVVSAVAAAAFVGSDRADERDSSSHREAPLIADDPAADNTDVYAFVSPDKPNTVTIIANYFPFEDPAGGPELLPVRSDRSLRAQRRQQRRREEDVTYQFRFTTAVGEPEHVPLQHGPVTSPDRPRPEREADVHGHAGDVPAASTVLGSNIAGAAGEHRPSLESDVRPLPGCRRPRRRPKVFAGPRDDPFFVDLGSIFDLGGLRPFNAAHIIPLETEGGEDGVRNYNVLLDRDPGAEDGSSASRRWPTESIGDLRERREPTERRVF